MEPRTIEAAFARFCRDSEPAAMAEVFDRAAPELYLLARRLTRGRSEADDLIQETFLAAIEHRASYDPARPLMPWLVGILIRQASSARRRSAREVDPRRVETSAVPLPETGAEEKEFHGLVMDALLRLSPRDRDVLVPLLFDGKRAVQIARELGHRPDTIRMRIHRALERLRRALPAGLGPTAQFGFGGGFYRVRGAVLRAAEGGGAGATAAPAPAAAAPAVAGWWLALGIAGAGAVLWQLAPPRATAPDGAALVQPPAPAGAGAQGTAGAGLPDPPRRAALAPPAPAPAAAADARAIQLAGRVSGPAPEAMALVRVELSGLGPDPIARRETAPVAEDGTFAADATELARLGARRILVRVDHPAFLRAETQLDTAAGLDAGTLELAPAHVVSGRVLLADRTPASGVDVALCSLRAGAQDILPVDTARTAADGAFHLRAPRGGAHAVIAHRAGLRPATARVDATPWSCDAGELLLEPGLSISGVVKAPEDFALAGTLVRCEAARTPGERRMRFADSRFLRVDGAFELATTFARCDERGRFELAGLGPQPFDLSIERAGASGAADPATSAPFSGRTGVRAPSFDVELELAWSLLEFRLDPELAAEPPGQDGELALDVSARDEAGEPAGEPVRLRLAPGGRASLQARPGTTYRAALFGCESRGARELSLTAPKAGSRTVVLLERPSDGRRAALALALEGAQLESGDWLGIGFFAPAECPGEGPSGQALFERRAPLQASRAVFDDLPPGRWRARVRVGGSYSRSFGFQLPLELDLDLAPGATLERALRTERGGRARVTVRTSTGAQQTAAARLFDSAGVEHPLQFVALEPESAREQSGRIVLDGCNEFGPLRPGAWRLEIEALWHAPLTAPFEIRAGEVVALTLRLEAR